jgi:hypothetical protein
MTGVFVLASGCTRLPCRGQKIEAFGVGDANPLKWLGTAASAAVGDVWLTSMTGLWSAALWLLKLSFQVIDAFTTPDLSATGPIGSVLPTTLWLGATLAVILMFVQLTVALVRRDGQSIGRVLIGIAQFGAVWVGYLGLAAGFVAAAAGLEHAILAQMLHAQDLSQVDLSESFPDKVSDITLATVLGVLGLLVVIPAAFFYLLIMFVHEAALLILVVTAPISAAGLVSEIGKVWFWKTLRWFFSCLLIAPMAALLLGVGVKLSTGVITPPKPTMCGATLCEPLGNAQQISDFANATNAAHAGMAVIGCIVIAVGACCPMILFRLLAFVEPGTASGAALRQSWSDAGGMSGIISGGTQTAGSSAATRSGGDGRSGGESGAESQTQSRLSSALGAFGTGIQVATSIALKATDLGSDILGQAGVGSPGYSMTPTDERSTRSSGRSRSSNGGSSDSSGGTGGGSGGGPAPEPPTPPMPAGGLPGEPGGAGGAGAGAAGGSEAAVTVVEL